MRDFLDIVFSFPTVIFTVSSILLLGFWMLTTLIGAGADAFEDIDFDFDADTDVDVDLDVDLDGGGSSGGMLRSALEFLGVGSMPLLLGLSLQSIFAWLASVVAMTVIGTGSSGIVRTLINFVVLAVAFLVGVIITRAIAKRFAHVFRPTHAAKQREFVGSVCTITTSRVTAEFGQAEVRDDEGGSLVVQVRCAKDNDLGAGDRALIFDLDTGTGEFHISPDTSLAP